MLVQIAFNSIETLPLNQEFVSFDFFHEQLSFSELL